MGVALLIGASLAPTDAALGQPVVANPVVPARIRRLLNVESGLNDGIATPFVLLALALATAEATGARRLVRRGAVRATLIGVAVGLALGLVGGRLLEIADARHWTSSVSRQLFVLALALGCYLTAAALGGNGFIAAFVGGLAFGAGSRQREEDAVRFTELQGSLLAIGVWAAFGLTLVGRLLTTLLDPVAIVYAVLSLTVIRMVPVAIALAGAPAAPGHRPVHRLVRAARPGVDRVPGPGPGGARGGRDGDRCPRHHRQLDRAAVGRLARTHGRPTRPAVRGTCGRPRSHVPGTAGRGRAARAPHVVGGHRAPGTVPRGVTPREAAATSRADPRPLIIDRMTLSVLVLGAGFGGLELSSRLSTELGAQVDVTLIDRSDSFVFGFTKLDVMFGRRSPESVKLRYRDIAHPRVRFRQETITAIDPAAGASPPMSGTYDADVLVVALGASYDLDATPGLAEAGHDFYSVPGVEHLRDVLPTVASGTVVIGVCGMPFKCPPAPSEAALLLDETLRERGIRDRVAITLVTPTPRPIGPSKEASDQVLARFAERGITFIGERRVASLDPQARAAVLDDGSRHPFSLFLGVPVHVAPPVVVAAGLTENGWIPVDRATLATRFPGVYAVGDVTSVGTAKAGVFAERAARVVADGIIARARGAAEPAGFDGTGSCWMEFGRGQVGRVDVDFFTTPGTPIGSFVEPSEQTSHEKETFSGTRRARWFGA